MGFRPPAEWLRAEERARQQLSAVQNQFEPQPLRRVEPVYPPAALQAGIRGNVRLRVLIARSGAVEKVEVVNGHPLLVEAARTAVSQWTYGPSNIETLVEVDLPFRTVSSR